MDFLNLPTKEQFDVHLILSMGRFYENLWKGGN